MWTYDFRGDGTYSRDSKNHGVSESAVAIKGTYVLSENRLLLTQTYRQVWTAGSPAVTETNISHETLSIEPNGDILEKNERFKKQ